ncbi:hypothetical protein ATO12_05745 [Aquimarina atlantica]|uniref:HTH tetR-type domain-containing protein n=1 Tax=Aquimarina atlantica TaxID=1317122 RepID=A0A023BPL0_9FLAO|nr:TetR/AcrR family transcriptional regulator [Aquimarina atlantica]EZH71879.1 hypothetical protein ATO12_05745 [Aquimarina atlantica]
MDTRSHLIETAFKLFLDKGYSSTSMANLVESSKLSKGAVYHHFENKEKLYIEVIDKYFLFYFKQVDLDAMKDMNLTEMDIILKDFFSSFIPKTITITPKGVSRHFILFFEAFEIHPTFKEYVRNFYDKLRKVLETGFKKNKSKNPENDAIILISKYEGLLFWQSVFPEQNIEQILLEI